MWCQAATDGTKRKPASRVVSCTHAGAGPEKRLPNATTATRPLSALVYGSALALGSAQERRLPNSVTDGSMLMAQWF